MLNQKYYKVLTKCGHVGRKHYVPVLFAIEATSKKEAAAIARDLPRVKHHHKDAILGVWEISWDDYLIIKENNLNDPYLKCRSRREQKETCDMTGRVYDDPHGMDEKKRWRKPCRIKIKSDWFVTVY